MWASFFSRVRNSNLNYTKKEVTHGKTQPRSSPSIFLFLFHLRQNTKKTCRNSLYFCQQLVRSQFANFSNTHTHMNFHRTPFFAFRNEHSNYILSMYTTYIIIFLCAKQNVEQVVAYNKHTSLWSGLSIGLSTQLYTIYYFKLEVNPSYATKAIWNIKLYPQCEKQQTTMYY